MSKLTCDCGTGLVYRGDYAAPGSGQSYKCPNCDVAYSKIGTTLVRLTDGNPDAPGWKPEPVDPYTADQEFTDGLADLYVIMYGAN